MNTCSRRILQQALLAVAVISGAPAMAADPCDALKPFLPESGDKQYSGLVDSSGKTVIPAGKYRVRGERNSDGRKIMVLWDDKADGQPVYYANCAGTIYPSVVSSKRGSPSKYDKFANSAVRIIDQGKYGYMDFDGKAFLPPQYEAASRFCSGFAVVGSDCSNEPAGVQCKETHYIDKSGKVATESDAEKARLANQSKAFCVDLD